MKNQQTTMPTVKFTKDLTEKVKKEIGKQLEKMAFNSLDQALILPGSHRKMEYCEEPALLQFLKENNLEKKYKARKRVFYIEEENNDE